MSNPAPRHTIRIDPYAVHVLELADDRFAVEGHSEHRGRWDFGQGPSRFSTLQKPEQVADAIKESLQVRVGLRGRE